jgi:putative DNA primase/helicase
MSAKAQPCAETVARALGGRKAGRGWIARCPAHDDRAPSLSISDGDGNRVLVRCHSGCGQTAVIAALRGRGLWTAHGRVHHSRTPSPAAPSAAHCNGDPHRATAALAIWRATIPAPGTPVETYLSSRGLNLPPPPSLRFRRWLKHPADGGTHWPAMVAQVTRGTDGEPMAIHRTFLARDGGGKAPVDPQKMILGPCRSGAVRLAEPNGVLLIGEGIETCLAAMQASGHPAWAALSTSGLRSLDLPKDVHDVIVLADGDEAGELAARDCALRWKRQGRRVRLARPPTGLDFNDLLRREPSL